jgi:hypothetical protein
MTDRELLQQALDALQGNWRTDESDKAIEALRARLAQPEPWVKTYSGGKPNYTEPKEWVGLTDAERELAAWSSSDFLKMAESIEAKLREKNG